MIRKKEGNINKVIYDNTVYNNGEYRIYPSIIEVKNLIKKIIEAKSTTKYLRVTPFYKNAKLNQQMEFDEYMFYMECRDELNEIVIQSHIGLCIGKEYANLNSEEVRIGSILFPLCKYEDIETYKNNLESYVKFLDEVIPKLMEIVKAKIGLYNEELDFGYFCFEVHSE